MENKSELLGPFEQLILQAAMSGFETLAQVYREIGSPKLKNLKIAANIVCGFAVVSTGGLTLFAAFIIPTGVRELYVDNLLGGLAMHLAGPEIMRLGFHAFVVVVLVLLQSSDETPVGYSARVGQARAFPSCLPTWQAMHQKLIECIKWMKML